MLIKIINPNTTDSMTQTIGRAARAVAAPGTEIITATSRSGAASIEGHYDEAMSIVGLVDGKTGEMLWHDREAKSGSYDRKLIEKMMANVIEKLP